MAFLKLLESLRTPVGDALFSGITHLGEEIFFIAVGLLIYWCLNKRTGFYLLLVSFSGTVVNQFLKLWVRMPRPWMLDPSLTIVESARAQALGFSFPSGHTQNILSVCGSVFICHKNRLLRAVCIALAVLVPFSRMYLGVHTPVDVLAAAGIALVLLFVFCRPSEIAMRQNRLMAALLAFMILLSTALLFFAELYSFPADADEVYVQEGIRNAWSLFGASFGFALGVFVDRRFLRFETKAVWWAQLLKFALGLAILLAIRGGLKALLAPVGHPWTNALRYFVILTFASAAWPATFPFFSRFGKRKA